MSKEFTEILASVRDSLSIGDIKRLQEVGLWRRRVGFGGSHSVAIYPPLAALQNNASLDPYDVAGGLEEPLELNLYIHNPFCEWVCHFCNYSIKTENVSPELESKMVEAIIAEIQNWKECLEDIERKPILRSVYIGGGTGLVMSCDSLNHLMATLVGESFSTRDPLHLCIESSSSALCRKDVRAKLGLLKGYGLNRISIGVQTLDDEILRIQGRGKSREDKYVAGLTQGKMTAVDIADYAVSTAREYTEDINVDLMQELSDDYGDATLEKDLEWFISCGPRSLTLYPTRYNPGSRAYSVFTSPSEATPEFTYKSVSRRMAVQERLQLVGYIDGPGGRFVKPGVHDIYKESRCTPDGRLLGVGCSAYSRLGRHFFQNDCELSGWLERVNQTRSGIACQYFVTDTELAEGQLINLLRHGGAITQFRECLPKTSNRTGFECNMEQLLNTGILREQDNSYKLTPLGRALEEEVVLLFFSEKNQQRLEKMYRRL